MAHLIGSSDLETSAELHSWLKGARTSWLTLTRGTIWLAVVIGPLLFLPSLGISGGNSKVWLYFTQVVAAVLVGLIFLLARNYNRSNNIKLWGICAGTFLVFAAAGFVCFQALTSSWTVRYNGSKWLIGRPGPDDLMPDAQTWLKDHPSSSPVDLLEQFTAENYEKFKIWKKEVLERRWLILSVLHVINFQFFAVCLITLTQAIRPAREKGPDTPPLPRKPKAHVFLSYSHANAQDAEWFKHELEAAGHQVWWDRDLLPGQNWAMEIHIALKRSYAVLLCFSAEIQAQQQSGVYPELRQAIEEYREFRPGAIFLIPVRFSECELPTIEVGGTLRFDQLHFVDLFPPSHRAAGLTAVVQALNQARESMPPSLASLGDRGSPVSAAA